MIKIGYKWKIDRNDYNDLYRLITILYNNSGYMAVCERLEDEKGNNDDRGKKGDIIILELKSLRIVHNSDEDDLERETYIKELQTLLSNK